MLPEFLKAPTPTTFDTIKAREIMKSENPGKVELVRVERMRQRERKRVKGEGGGKRRGRALSPK